MEEEEEMPDVDVADLQDADESESGEVMTLPCQFYYILDLVEDLSRQ